MRLHPAEDGLIPEPSERGVKTRDRSGNRLIDVVDPKTGFCTGVRSPMTIPAGQSVLPHTPVSAGVAPSGSMTQFDTEHKVYYDLLNGSDSEKFGVVVRTEADGDNPLRCTRVRVVQAVMPHNRQRNVTGDRSGKSAAQRKSVSTRVQNDQAVKAVLISIGYTGTITPQVRKVVLEMIELEKTVPGYGSDAGKFLRSRLIQGGSE